MSEFIHFKDISPDDPNSWKNRKIISLDIDWVEDDILNMCIDLLEEARVKACFFITHVTPVLKRIFTNPLFELGIHPNFNPLIDGKPDGLTAPAIINKLLDIVPSSSVLRSHSMTTSGRWLGLYKEKGIQYLSNYIQYGAEPIVPFRHINGLIEVPVYFADDGYAYINETKETANIDLASVFMPNPNGVKVYNFHPVHLALNTFYISEYTRYKLNGSKINNSDNPAGGNLPGALNLFKQLLCLNLEK